MTDKRGTDTLIGTRLGAYDILARIGKGGAGTVYKARQASVGREVAIKVMSEIGEPDSPYYERFQREVSLIATLEHPHILPIYDFGQIEGIPYLVMRYLDGGSLNGQLAGKSLPLAEVNRLLSQVCSALDYAHTREIVHRDIKPHNVLLDAAGNAYLSDFGIAKVIGGADLTQTGEAIGTPSYMPPEQWQGLAINFYADIYAVGIMLYEMLTGVLPFRSDNLFSLMYKHLNDAPPLVTAKRPDLTPEFDLIILQALDKIPTRRHPSAGALARAIHAAISGEGRTITLLETAFAPNTTEDQPTLGMAVTPSNLALSGRAWAIQAFDAWREEESPILFIVGPHGIGKSALAARFADRLGKRVIHYALVAEQARTLDPRAFVETLAAELTSVIPGWGGGSTGNALDEIGLSSAEAFEARVLSPISRETETIYLIIDSLEASFEHPGGTIVDLLEIALRSLPEALRLIVTGAPHPRLERLFRQATWLELNPDNDQLRADLHETLSTRFATLFPNLSGGDFDLPALIEKSAGNPLYLNVILEYLALRKLDLEEIAAIPAGLDGLYAYLVGRLVAEDGERLTLLTVLAAARAALPERLLGTILDERLEVVRGRLGALTPLIQNTSMGWKLAHPALRYWLIDAHHEALQAAHRRIASALRGDSSREYNDLYTLQYLPSHLALSQQTDEAFAVATDMNFLAARLGRVSLAEVLDDLNQVRAALPAEEEERRAALDILQETLERLIPAFTTDAAGTFSYLYNALIGVPVLHGALESAAETRRGVWLRLVAPISRAEVTPSHELWAGLPILGMAGDATGKRLVVVTEDRRIALFSGGELYRMWDGGTVMLACAMTEAGNLALTGGEGSAAFLWDTGTGALVRVLEGHKRRVTGIALSADGSRALTASDDKLLRLWDAETGTLLRAFYEHPDVVRCGVFLSDGMVASGCADGLVRLWDVRQNILITTLKGHRGVVTSGAAFTDENGGMILVTGGTDGQIILWDTTAGTIINTLSGAAAGIAALTVGVLNGRRVLAAAGEDRTLWLWTLERGGPVARFVGHRSPVTGVVIESEGGRILSAALDGMLRAWTPRTLSPRLSAEPFQETHTAALSAIRFNPEGGMILTTSVDRTARLWRAADGALLQTFRGHSGALTGGDIRPDGRLVVTASTDKTARLWDVGRGTQHKMLTGAGEALRCVSFSSRPITLPNAPRPIWLAATGGADRAVRLYDAESGALVQTLKGHRDVITACLFSPTDERLVTISQDRTVRVWLPPRGEKAAEVAKIEGGFATGAFSPDGASLLLGGDDGSLSRYLFAEGRLVRLSLRVAGAIRAVGVLRGGRLIYAATGLGTLTIWDAEKETPLAMYRGRRPLTAAAADGVTLAVGDDQGAYAILRLEGLGGGRRKASLI